MKRLSLLLTLISLIFIGTVNAQNKFGFHGIANLRGEGSVGYTFFSGTDAASFTTTVKGFGSGLEDALNSRVSLEFISFGTDRFNLTTGIGNNIVKYRFADNLIINRLGPGGVEFTPDADSSHNYVNTFFGYGKTKLVTSSMYIPLNLNIRMGKEFQATIGAFADWLFFAKYKMKYLVNDLKVKEVILSDEMLDLPFNRFRFGLHAGLFHYKTSMGLAFTYLLTPMFKTGMGPDLHECRVTLQYAINDLKTLGKKNN